MLIVSLLLWLSFFRGPQTVLQDGTNTNAISYTDKQFFFALKERYPEIYQNIELENDQAYYVIPGLKQSSLIHHSGNQKGKVGIATDMTPQGLVVVENKYLIISAYSKSKAYNSVLWLLNLKNGQFIKTIALDDIDHVGAITFDDEHDRLWIATINKSVLGAIKKYQAKDKEKSKEKKEANKEAER